MDFMEFKFQQQTAISKEENMCQHMFIQIVATYGSPQLEGYILELTKGKYRGKKKTYTGKVIKDSFIDDKFLEGIKIEDEELSIKDNSTVYTIKVPEDTIKNLAENLKSNKYYMYFWNDKNIMIVYKDKTFEINKTNGEELEEAINYGISLGISKEELDFWINRIKQEE